MKKNVYYLVFFHFFYFHVIMMMRNFELELKRLDTIYF